MANNENERCDQAKWTENIEIRTATPNDIVYIDRLQHEAFPGDVLLMSRDEMISRIRGAKKGEILVACGDNKVVAYCVLTDRPFRPWTGWDFLAVSPTHWRLGIATKLTEEVCRCATRPFIRGFVRSKNKGALSHYKKIGFFQTGRKRKFYSDGDDAIVLLKPLLGYWHSFFRRGY
ncbi:MAG: N-acetyltransferase [Pseudomonadota bacterium]